MANLKHSVIEEYLQGAEWAVKDNANIPHTISGLLSHVQGATLYLEAQRILPEVSLRLHNEGWIYIYKLKDGSIVRPYCGGIDSRLIVEKGLRTPTIVSRPPKHLDSAVDQLVNAIYIFSQERTGAVGLYGVDLVLAPFIRKDGLEYRAIKQNIQRFIYNLNYPLKSGQSPFTNVVFALSNRFYRSQPAVVGEGVSRFRLVLETYDSFIEEACNVVKAFAEVLESGDALHQPFTFPIPTTIINGDFEKSVNNDPELWETYWRMVTRVGQMYFLNGYRHRAEDIFSFCCRLLSDMKRVREVLHQARGVWDMPPSVGSINVVVLNLPRLAMIARVSDEERARDQLDKLLEVSRAILMWFRARYLKLFKQGLYPMTREYIDPDDPFKFYYNTIGLVGLAEYAAIMLGDPFLWFTAQPSDLVKIEKLYRDVLNHIHSRLQEFEEEDGVLYNVEEVPGETLGVKLAYADLEFAKSLSTSEDLTAYIPVGEVEGRKVPFYTNQLTPPYTTLHLKDQLELEASCQKLFTGGVIKHVFVDRELDHNVVARFVLQTMRDKDIVYLSITPTVAVCPVCGHRSVGRWSKCPGCGAPMNLWSRVVGYYRPVTSWNSGRVAEFTTRRDLSRDLEELAKA